MKNRSYRTWWPPTSEGGKRVDTSMEEHGRRLHILLRIAALAGVALLLLGSCQVASLLFGVTIDQRIKDFSSGYTGGDYANLYSNFSDSTQQKNAMKDPTFWDSTPFASANGPKAIATYSINNSTVTGIFSNANGDFDLTMQMQESGIDWYILSTLAGPTDIKLLH